MSRKTQVAVPDMRGSLAVITGASDGIGHALATRLAVAGADLVLPVRNLAKGEGAAREIRAVAAGADIRLLPMDLSSLRSVADLAQTLVSEGRPINVLINNAGVMSPTRAAGHCGWIRTAMGDKPSGAFCAHRPAVASVECRQGAGDHAIQHLGADERDQLE